MSRIEPFQENTIIIGNCHIIMPQMPDECVDLIIVDPPYGHVTQEDWDKGDPFNSAFIRETHRILKVSGSIYTWCGIGEKSKSLLRFIPLLDERFIFKDLITWKKQRGIGMRKGWLYTREEILWYVKDNKKFIWQKEEQYGTERRLRDRGKNVIQPSQTGHYAKSLYKRLTNVWTDITEESFNITRKIKHFTPKPIKALERIIKVHTFEGDLVFDPMIGSGSTAVAAKQLNRNFFGCDIDPDCIEESLRRFQEI